MYIYLLIYYLPAFTVPDKNEKKTSGTRDKSISNHRPGEKENNYRSQRKKKPTSSDPLKKIKGHAVSWSKEN